jgi:hypothetical protein
MLLVSALRGCMLLDSMTGLRLTSLTTFQSRLFLHGMNLKYKQIEDKPNIQPFKFKPRKNNLDWKVVNEVNLNPVIESNNIQPLNALTNNITYSNIFKDDLKNYPEALVVKLIRILQLSLE